MVSVPVTAEIQGAPQGKPESSLRIVPLLATTMLTALLTVAGVVGATVYLARSGRLAATNMASETQPAITKTPDLPRKTHVIALDPMLVNLADADGHSYLRVGVTLQVEDPIASGKAAKEPEAKDAKAAADAANAPLRDAVLDVLGRQQVAALLLSDGKNKLKAELKRELLDRNPDVKVTEVYFTEFLVQR